MELKIIWLKLAEDKLIDIYNYHKAKAGKKIALNLVNDIVEMSSILENQPYIGAIEEFLNERSEGFRYILSNKYKIIYYVNLEGGFISIANVFDTRQNPIKLTETKS